MAITKTKVITLTVTLQDGDFSISSADTVSVKAGTTSAFTVSIHPLLGFNKAVKFSITGGPAGMVTTWTPSDTLPAGGASIQCNLAVPLDNALVGSYPLTLTGVSQ
jgi:hypothetical protein